LAYKVKRILHREDKDLVFTTEIISLDFIVAQVKVPRPSFLATDLRFVTPFYLNDVAIEGFAAPTVYKGIRKAIAERKQCDKNKSRISYHCANPLFLWALAIIIPAISKKGKKIRHLLRNAVGIGASNCGLFCYNQLFL